MKIRIVVKRKKRIILFVVFAILSALWMSTIFGFSSNDAAVSSEQSDGVTEWLLRLFDGDFIDMPEQEQLELIEKYDGMVRKLAHFAAFSVLGVLVYTCLASLARLTKQYIISAPISVSFCVAFAVSDEIHQTFVEGRAGRFTDVLIDGAGVLVGTGLAMLIVMLIRKKRKNKKRKDA